MFQGAIKLIFAIKIVMVINIWQMEKDVSVRQQAVDLLYAMCDKTNAEEIVQEMLNYLETADYSIREEMVIFLFFLLWPLTEYFVDFSWEAGRWKYNLLDVKVKKGIEF